MKLNPSSLNTRMVRLPLNAPRVSFNDLNYDPRLEQILVPAAETGQLALIGSKNLSAQLIGGFSKGAGDDGEAAIGAVSAVSTRGMIFALDRSAKKINIIDPARQQVVGSTSVDDTPDYIRFVTTTNELWVTESAAEQIEVFKITDGSPPELDLSETIDVPSGPENLVIDRRRGLAFTNQPGIGQTAVIQVITHGIIAQWGNGCSKARGMSVDEERGYLFIACAEGKLVMLDINNDGAQVASQTYGGELNAVFYNPQLRHIYLPSGASAILAVFAVKRTAANATLTPESGSSYSLAATSVASDLSLVRLGTADTALNAHCVTADDQNRIWVCDPDHGQLFLIEDTFPPSSE